MSAKNEKLAIRLAEILRRLNEAGQIDIHQLSEEFGVSLRTIQKDLNDRFAFLDLEKKGARHYRLNRNQLGLFYKEDIDRFAHFASIQHLFPKTDRAFYQKTLTDSIKVKGLPYENLEKNHADFHRLRNAIEKHQLINFCYLKKGQTETYRQNIEPYTLLNKNGLWYLIGKENGNAKTFSFTQIKTLVVKTETFVLDEDFKQEIATNDSISHGNQMPEVIIRVSAEVANYFQRRNLLPNQEIIRELKGGELYISCRKIHELEILPIVQYWIPYLTIMEPKELKEKLHGKLEMFLKMN